MTAFQSPGIAFVSPIAWACSYIVADIVYARATPTAVLFVHNWVTALLWTGLLLRAGTDTLSPLLDGRLLAIVAVDIVVCALGSYCLSESIKLNGALLACIANVSYPLGVTAWYMASGKVDIADWRTAAGAGAVVVGNWLLLSAWKA